MNEPNVDPRRGRSERRRTRRCVVLLACLCVALALGVVASSAARKPSFARPTLYGTGDGPEDVAIGDLNADGKPDLVTANFDVDTVSVLLNKGKGRFHATRDYPTGHGDSLSVALGDLNGDGKPDLATTNYLADTVSVLLNTGDGSFQPNVDYPTGKGAGSVAIGDLSGDGKPDLAIANVGTDEGPGNTVSVLLNKGDGTFQAKVDYPTGREPASVAIGDLNDDGKPDLAIANAGTYEAPGHTLSLLLNRGDGTLQAKVDYPTGKEPASVAIGDVNGDGKPDLLTANVNEAAAVGPGNTVSVLLNKSDGTFGPGGAYRTGNGPASVAIGDLNGDGKPDLVTANDPDRVSVRLNTTGLCTVPNVKRKTLPAAKRAIARANCRVGKVSRAYSKPIRKGRVISAKPKPDTVLPKGSKVNLVVSLGRKG
jgi:hypothetical protein